MIAIASTQRPRSALTLQVLLLGLVVLAGCSGDDVLVSRAQNAFLEKMSEDQDFERYALQIAEGTDSPVVRQRVLEAIGSDNFQTALVAVRSLGERPAEDARAPLRQVFENKGGALKLQAGITLARLGDEEAVEYVKAQVADPAQPINAAAVAAVAEREEGEALLRPLLSARMKDESSAARDEVYAALGTLGQPWAVPLLMEGLQNERGEGRQQAIQALGLTGESKIAPEIERFVNTQGLVFVTLEALGKLGNSSSVAAVKTMIGNTEPTVRTYAAVALLRLGEKDQAMEQIDALVQHEDPTVRGVLAEQLAGVTDDAARSRLAALAADSDSGVRIAAIRSIGEDAGPEFQETLLQAAADTDYQVQTLALNVLAKIGTATAIEPIKPLIDSENPYVRLGASHAVLSIHARSGAEEG